MRGNRLRRIHAQWANGVQLKHPAHRTMKDMSVRNSDRERERGWWLKGGKGGFESLPFIGSGHYPTILTQMGS